MERDGDVTFFHTFDAPCVPAIVLQLFSFRVSTSHVFRRSHSANARKSQKTEICLYHVAAVSFTIIHGPYKGRLHSPAVEREKNNLCK